MGGGAALGGEQVGDHHMGPRRGEARGDRGADAAGGAGDEGGAAGQVGGGMRHGETPGMALGGDHAARLGAGARAWLTEDVLAGRR